MLKKGLILMAALAALLAGIMASSRLSAQFELVNGQTGRLDDYAGRYLVINYFARWCAPCLREIPELNAFVAGMDTRQTAFLAVDWDRLPKDKMQAMIDELDMRFAVVSDDTKMPIPFTRPDKLPATFILGPDGELAATLWGEQTAASIDAKLAELQ